MFSLLLGALAGASLVAAQSQISWTPCGHRIECGTYSAPLDYANPSVGQATIYVTRYLGSASHKKGSIFVNPGGPGGSGSQYIYGNGAEISSIVGPEWDIVGFDPRGVNMTIPRVECFQTAEEEQEFWAGQPLNVGLEAHGDLTDPADLQQFLSYVPGADTLLDALYERCFALSGDILPYVGSVAVVRDIVGMNAALHGPDADIYYWGFSYGTLLGVYLSQLFPEKIGRVVIDGVVDPVIWSTAPPHKRRASDIHDADATLKGFAQACAAAGNNCDLAKILNGDNTTPDDILGAIDSILETSYKRGIENNNYTSGALRPQLYQSLYSPSQWEELATGIAQVYEYFNPTSGNVRARSEPPSFLTRSTDSWKLGMTSPGKRDNASRAKDYSFQGVSCADAPDPSSPPVTTEDVFLELVYATQTVSRYFGPIWSSAGIVCHKWTSRAVERYTGPFNRPTKYPIITIGTEADPVTPFVNARAVDALLGDSSRLVLQDDWGHTSLALKSDCSRQAIGAYFNNGTLPSADDNTMCGTNMAIFPGAGITKNYLAAQAAHESNVSTLNNLQRNSKLLFIVSIAQGALIVALVIGLGVTYAKMKKARHGGGGKYIKAAGSEWQASHEEHSRYDDPFEKTKH